MLLALLALILWPLAEIYVAIRIAEAIGWAAMLLLLIAGWPVGAYFQVESVVYRVTAMSRERHTLMTSIA